MLLWYGAEELIVGEEARASLDGETLRFNSGTGRLAFSVPELDVNCTLDGGREFVCEIADRRLAMLSSRKEFCCFSCRMVESIVSSLAA